MFKKALSLALAFTIFTAISAVMLKTISSAIEQKSIVARVPAELLEGLSTNAPSYETENSDDKGATRPSNTWNLKTQGRYSFSGYTGHASKLYTDYTFTGKDSYYVYVKNNSKNPLEVQVKTLTHTYATHPIPAGRYLAFYVDNIKSGHEPYIWFGGRDINLSGYIE